MSDKERQFMSTKTTTPGQDSPGNVAMPVNITPSGQAGLKLYEREIATYLRELPRLLEERHAWRHALIKGDEILSVWDTQGDAIQAGREKFGLEPIFVKTIDPRDPERFVLLEAAKEVQACDRMN
jgi:hypothetical protein